MRTTLIISLPVLVLCASVGADAAPVRANAPQAGRGGPAASGELPLTPAARLPSNDPDERVSVYVVLQGRSAVESVPRGVAPDSNQGRAVIRRETEHLRAWHRTVARRLEGMGAREEADLIRLANAIQVNVPVRLAAGLARVPGVVAIERVPRYDRSLTSAVPFVGAPALWGNPGLAVTGKGVRVGIVDTGIDYLHADFGGPGAVADYQQNDRTVIEPGTFPTSKVVGGWDFVGDDYTGTNSPVPDPDPLDCARMQSQYISGGHGTHVAGIAAGQGVLTDGTPFDGPYEASYDPSIFRVGPGVAPEASLVALKIFGCDGSTTMVAAALEWAVDPNGDGDTSDRLDVVNMSLGGSYGLQTPTDEKVLANLTAAGTMVVVAAGNDGDTFYATGEPSTSTEVLSVGATTDVVTYQALRVDAPTSIAGDMACVEGGFTKPLSQSGPLTGQLIQAQPANGCSALTNASALHGKVALVDRGSCTFVDKLKNAYAAGAAAVVVADNAANEPPFAMGGDGSTTVGIPGVMIAKSDGDAIRPELAQGVTVTLDASNIYASSADADEMADFSSRGPRSEDNRLKPDITAPGVSIDSAGVGTGADPREMSGTSMACPMVTGGAALVRQANPSFSPYDVKAAMMNTAAPIKDAAGRAVPASLAGAGRMQVDRAARSMVLAATDEVSGAVSVSFGSMVTAEPASATRSIVVDNRGDQAVTLDAVVEPAFVPAGVSVTLEPTQVQVPAKGTAKVTVTLSVDPAALPIEAPDPDTPATISLGGGQSYARHFLTEASGVVALRAPGASDGDELRVPFHGVVRAGSELTGELAARCEDAPADEIQIPITGASAHKEPVTSAFQLVATSPQSPVETADEMTTDLVAVGVATNAATAASFDKASVYFGLAVAGTWTTPAKGQLSLVGVGIDTNGDGKSDYNVFAEPLSKDAPYADVLTATTYQTSTGAVVGRRFLNLVPRDVYNTEPFNNSVVVLPVTLSTIGLSEGNTAFQFYAFTQGLTFPATKDSTAWATYDPYHAPLDTARDAKDGIPFWPGLSPLRVHVNQGEAGGEPLPSVLLLFHSNIAGKRWQVVDVANATVAPVGDLKLEAKAPGQVEQNATTEISWTVTNAGQTEAADAKLEISIEGADSIGTVTSSQGTCSTKGATIDCAIGAVAAGASMRVSVEVGTDESDIHALAAVGTTPDCDSAPGDNRTSTTIQVGDVQTGGTGGTGPAMSDRAIDGYEPGGGCSCAVAGDRRGTASGAAAGAIGLAMLWWTRRRRRTN